MQLEIITTGDEIMTGMVTDTNVSWLCQELLNLGVQAARRSTVGDSLEDLTAVISERSQEADLIIVNGGLGPTSDDNTTVAAAKAAGVKLVRHDEWVQKIRAWCDERHRPMLDTNLKQADLPEGATMIDNPCGTACGYYLKIKKALCFFTPGVPREFKAMMTDSILPKIKTEVIGDNNTKVKRLFLFGVGESKLQAMMNTLSIPESITLGYAAGYPLLELKLICHNAKDEEFNQALSAIRDTVRNYFIMEDRFDVAGEIAKITGDDPLVIFDNVTAGLIGSELFEGRVNLNSLLATHESLNLKSANFLGTLTQAYALILDRDNEDQGIHIIFNNNKLHKDYHFYYQLNITIKDKTRAAYSLVAQTLLLKLLKGDPDMLKPDDGEFADLTDISDDAQA